MTCTPCLWKIGKICSIRVMEQMQLLLKRTSESFLLTRSVLKFYLSEATTTAGTSDTAKLSTIKPFIVNAGISIAYIHTGCVYKKRLTMKSLDDVISDGNGRNVEDYIFGCADTQESHAGRKSRGGGGGGSKGQKYEYNPDPDSDEDCGSHEDEPSISKRGQGSKKTDGKRGRSSSGGRKSTVKKLQMLTLQLAVPYKDPDAGASHDGLDLFRDAHKDIDDTPASAFVHALAICKLDEFQEGLNNLQVPEGSGNGPLLDMLCHAVQSARNDLGRPFVGDCIVCRRQHSFDDCPLLKDHEFLKNCTNSNRKRNSYSDYYFERDTVNSKCQKSFHCHIC